MSRTIKFSAVYGENVSIDKNFGEAKWMPVRSGGWMFSSSPLEAGRQIHVTLDGSGHCDLGVIRTDPMNCDILQQPSLFKKLNGVQIHKMKCRIPVRLNRDGNEVKSEYNGNIYKKNINRKGYAWIAVYIKFGDVSTQLVEENTGKLNKFSDNHGTNIRLDDGKRQAKTVNSNPAALCFVGKKILPGETIHFVCEPIKEGDRKPSRFHLKLLVSHKNPDSLLDDFRATFDTSIVPVSDPMVTVLEMLEKGECDGRISISLDVSTNRICYVSATNKQNNQTLNLNASSGVWVGFELYRVGVKLTVCKVQQTVEQEPLDVVDSKVRDPRNEEAETSLEPFDSFVNHRLNRYRDDTQDKGPPSIGYSSHSTLLPGHCATTHRHIVKDTRKPTEKVNQNLKAKNTQTNEQAGNINASRAKGQTETFRINDGSYTIGEETIPKAKNIPKPEQIPIPSKPNEVTYDRTTNRSVEQAYVASTSHPNQKPYVTSFHRPTDFQNVQSKQINGVETDAKEQNKLMDSILDSTIENPLETFPPPGDMPVNMMGACNDTDAIANRLYRIEKKTDRIEKSISMAVERNSLVNIGMKSHANRGSLTHDDVSAAENKECPIQKNWVVLVEYICADKVCDHLFQEIIISDDEREYITNLYKSDRKSANRYLLQLLKQRKIQKAKLIEVLNAVELSHLVEKLNQ